MVRKVVGKDKGHIYAMKVLKKATLKGKILYLNKKTFIFATSLLLKFKFLDHLF